MEFHFQKARTYPDDNAEDGAYYADKQPVVDKYFHYTEPAGAEGFQDADGVGFLQNKHQQRADDIKHGDYHNKPENDRDGFFLEFDETEERAIAREK